MGATAQPLNVNPTVAAFGQLGQSNAARRQRRDAQRSALFRTAGALGGLAVSGGNPLGAAIGSEVGGALSGQAPNVPQLIQTGVALQDRSIAAESTAADQAALNRASQQFQGTPGQEFFDPDTGGVTEEIGGTPPNLQGALGTLLTRPRTAGAALGGSITLAGQRAATERAATTATATERRFQQKETRLRGTGGDVGLPKVGKTIDQPLGKGLFQKHVFTREGVFIPLGKPFRKRDAPGERAIRDTAFVNVAPEGQTPIWETRAITSDAQVADLVKQHGQDRVTLEDPRRGQAAASEQLLRERRRAAQVGAAGAPGPPSAPIPAPTAGAGQKTGRTLEAIQGGGIGPASNLAEVLDNVVGGLGLQSLIGMEGGSIFPEVQKNRQHLRAMRMHIQGVMKQSNRFAKWEKDQINPILPDPDKFWKNPATSANQLVELRDLFTSKIALNNNAIRSGTLTDKQVDELNLKNIELTGMLSFMRGTPSQPQAAPPRQQEDAFKLFNTDTTGMSLPELKAHRTKLESLSGGAIQ